MGGTVQKMASSGFFGVLGVAMGNQAKRQEKANRRMLQGAEEDPVAAAPVAAALETDRESTKKKRVNLFETAGGVSGQELNPNQVSKRPTLLGN